MEFNKDTTYEVFKAVWGLMNAVRKDYSDESWEMFVKNANVIHEKYNNKFYDNLLLIITEEAEAEFKIKDKIERHARYEATWKSYTEAWNLFESLLVDFESANKKVTAYNKKHNSRFASKISNAVLCAVSELLNAPGSFVRASFPFYQKYSNGINDAVESDAYRDAESIIEKYPGYTLQMMDMIDALKSKAISHAA